MTLQRFLFIFDCDKSFPRPESISPARWAAMWKHCQTHYGEK